MNWRWILILSVVVMGCSEQEGDRQLETGYAALELNVPGEFVTIQEALNAAAPGDTVLVAPGDYTENVTLHCTVTLQGAGPGQTILRGQVRFFSKDGCTVTGFTVTAEGASGYSPDVGISVDGELFEVVDNVVEGFGSGIGVEATVEGELSRNLLRNNGTGIEVNEAAVVLMQNNVVTNNSKSGIVLYSMCSGIDIVHNTVVGNGFAVDYEQGGAGIVLGPFCSEKVQNNIVVSNRGGINSMDGSNSQNQLPTASGRPSG